MFHDVTIQRILVFAQHIDDPAKPPLQKAVDRGWLTDDGAATMDGRALVQALLQQHGTRSFFRMAF